MTAAPASPTTVSGDTAADTAAAAGDTRADTAGDTGDLVRRAAAGDAVAWRTLTRRHEPLLRAVARGYRLPDAQVEDVVQTAWLRLVENVGRLRQPERVVGWLVTTVRRESLAALRSGRREEPRLADVDSADEGFWGEVAAPEDDLLHAEDCRRVRDALGRLPERQRLLLTVLVTAPELDYLAVSRALSMPVGSIGPTRGRALVRLRALLGDTSREPLAA